MKNEMKVVTETLTQFELMKKDMAGYHKLTEGLEQKIDKISVQAKSINKLQKDFTKASLLADELKARQKSLIDEESLINKAITAASKLEELIYKAEHIKSKAKK